MCGICGIYGYFDKSDVIEMMSVLKHRGPDSNGSFSDGDVSLGHRRLAIIDLSENGRQPMINEDGSIVLVVNGEIYNYKDLRTNLMSKGHTFRSDSDSEVIVHAYEEYGEWFVNMLRGMFALALYDRKQHKLILARDPIGKKPLYYFMNSQAQKIVFASEIKALFKAGIPCEVNFEAIPSYLMYQYVMGEDTLFKRVQRLPAGCMLIARPEDIRLEKYWQLSEGNLAQCDNDIIRGLRVLLEESVKLRLQSDVPVGSFLSGGIDSSAITALYRKFYNGDMHTFTASFDTNSEAEYAKLVSQYLDVKYHEIKITADMVARDIEKITWHHDEPLGDAATINNYYLSQEAKKHVTVVLAGEGGDELFGGYPWHRYVPAISAMDKIPTFVCEVLQPIVDILLGQGDATSRFNKWHRILSFPLQKTLTEMQLYPTTAMSQQNMIWLTGLQGNGDGAIVPDMRNSLNQMLGLDCLNLLQKFLMKADKATMAHAIEERLPLLDRDVIQYAFAVPPRLKKDKYVLRKAVEDLLPREIAWRRKQGFGTPLADWLNSPRLKEMTIDRLSNGALLREFCNPKALDKLVDCVRNGGMKLSGAAALGVANIVWSLLALQVWHDVFFGDKIENCCGNTSL